MITDRVLKKGQKKTVAILLLILGLFIVTVCAQVRFDPLGKRDPFVSLLKKEKVVEVAQILPPPPLEERPPGLAGLLISEVTVTGTASNSDTQMAILSGIDGMTYFAQEGTKLFDGYLDKISPEEIVFFHQQVDTRGKKRVSKVTKRIQTEDQ